MQSVVTNRVLIVIAENRGDATLTNQVDHAFRIRPLVDKIPRTQDAIDVHLRHMLEHALELIRLAVDIRYDANSHLLLLLLQELIAPGHEKAHAHLAASLPGLGARHPPRALAAPPLLIFTARVGTQDQEGSGVSALIRSSLSRMMVWPEGPQDPDDALEAGRLLREAWCRPQLANET